jgi:hypothetical protein
MPYDDIHQVTLNYAADAQGNLTVSQPPAIKVRNGHQIIFNRGSVPPENKVVIIFTEPQFFSSPFCDEGHAPVSVMNDLPHRTFYQCGLRAADGHIIPTSLSGPFAGGQIDPESGN